MTTKFKKDMYAKMRDKKDEPLSNIGRKAVRVKGVAPTASQNVSVNPIVSVTEQTRTASPATSIEEIPTPASKKQRTSGKEKADSRSSTIWDDERLAVDRAHEVVTTNDLKVFKDVPFTEVASRHIQRLVQVLGESIHITSEHLTQEARVASLTSRMENLEKENSELKRNLVESMDESNTSKEKVKTLSADLRAERQLNLEKDEQLLNAKESLKTIAARSIEAFQTTDEYQTVLFSWYFKGFELLRRYLVKHPSGVDMEKLDLEEVDQEMAADEVVSSSAIQPDVSVDVPARSGANEDAPGDDEAA
ncbi:uncharacterized protein LOC136063291 [Quercus suber]|uniref:uncharacterized protein LOC136063291 n=1 Tax=Quercus suber TaxID=58331 RepID=UPI0032DFFBCC